MRVIALILLSLPLTVFSSDRVIETLKAENSMLKKRIQQNNKLIQLRSKSTYKIETNEVNIEDSTGPNIAMGLESVNWGEELNEFVPTLAFSYTFHNKVSLGASYGQFDSVNFPVAANLATIGITQAFLSYTVDISRGFSFRPLVGYVNYTVSTNLDSLAPSEAEFGQFEVEDIQNRSGSFAGFALVKEFYSRWNTTFRADIGKSASLFLGYRL